MKTIEEAAKYYSDANYKENDYGLTNIASNHAFKAGVEFAQRWIPVEEELPNECTFVLTKYKNTYSVSWYDGQFNEMYNPTHWRQIELK